MLANGITDIFNVGLGNDLIGMIFGKVSGSTTMLPPSLNNTMRKMFGFVLDEFMISCTFNFAPCNSSDFDWFYNALYGKA
jgi:hypothetical protein